MIRMRKHPEPLPPSEGNRMSGRDATASPRKQEGVAATGQMRLPPYAGAGSEAAGDSRRGMVLLTVLWTIALMSALAMAAAVSFRGFAGVAAVGRDRVQGDALLTAGLEMAAGTVASLGDMPLTEREIAVALSTGSVRARFSDEGGRIDIGKVPSAVLASLLRFVGASEQEAQGVAQRIVEWRRRNTVRPMDGGAAPRNDATKKPDVEQPFADLREVAQVPGMATAWLI